MEKNFLIQTARAVNFTESEGSPVGSDGNESAYNVGDSASMLGSRRPPGEGHGNPLQYSCLEKSMN